MLLILQPKPLPGWLELKSRKHNGPKPKDMLKKENYSSFLAVQVIPHC